MTGTGERNGEETEVMRNETNESSAQKRRRKAKLINDV